MKKKNNQPSYAVKWFKIENFKGIKSLEVENLPESAPWIFLTGENGYGKTCVLQALAMGIYGTESHTFQFGKQSPPVAIDIKITDTQNGSVLSGHSTTSGNVVEQMQVLDCITCYGSARLDSSSESSQKEMSPTLSLFDSRTLLENIELKLSRWYFKTHDTEYQTKYKKVTNILKKLLDLKAIKVDKKSDKVLYIEKDRKGKSYSPLPSKQLAAGYRSIICMIGDMILRLFETQPDTFDPAELKGIILIDELDLHLHPIWQKRLPGLLSKIFPRIQFIVSTHSPIPLLAAPPDSVFLKVNRCESTGITIERLEQLEKQLPDLLPNTILTSPAFGFQEMWAGAENR